MSFFDFLTYCSGSSNVDGLPVWTHLRMSQGKAVLYGSCCSILIFFCLVDVPIPSHQPLCALRLLESGRHQGHGLRGTVVVRVLRRTDDIMTAVDAVGRIVRGSGEGVIRHRLHEAHHHFHHLGAIVDNVVNREQTIPTKINLRTATVTTEKVLVVCVRVMIVVRLRLPEVRECVFEFSKFCLSL